MVNFSRGKQKIFPGGLKYSEISFYPLETKKTTFFAQHLMGNIQ